MAEMISKAAPKKAANKTSVASTKPAEKKPVVATAAVKKAAVAVDKAIPKKSAVVSKKPSSVKPKVEKSSVKVNKAMTVTDEQRYRMVAEAAYYRAESNQFKSDPLRDWIDAESDISALLSGSK